MYDTLTGVAIESSRSAARGILDEFLFGKQGKSVTDQLNTAYFQLEMIRQKHQGITIVEDEEASMLARINELERERANIYLNILLDVLNKVLNKLEDMAINMLLQGLLNSGSSEESDLSGFGQGTPLYGSPAKPFGGSWGQPSGKVVSITAHNVYGVDGFNKLVQTAIKEIDRNLS